jgi:hypothetical protein
MIIIPINNSMIIIPTVCNSSQNLNEIEKAPKWVQFIVLICYLALIIGCITIGILTFML